MGCECVGVWGYSSDVRHVYIVCGGSGVCVGGEWGVCGVGVWVDSSDVRRVYIVCVGCGCGVCVGGGSGVCGVIVVM